jgi:lipid-A-disaccharide synthase
VSTLSPRGPIIALVAGEASGDNLGAALIEALRKRFPEAQFVGIAGPKMRAAGCEALASSEELALMGLAEILRHLPRLIGLRRRIVRELLERSPALFVGIDAPEFNLGLARVLKSRFAAVGRSLRTVQYVSPQVWAWREGRVRKIAAACDRILCLLPFEPEFYARYGVAASFVGHPLADQFPLEPDRAGARAALGIAPEARLVALLPGSRVGEVSRLAEPFIGAAAWLASKRSDLQFIAPLTTATTRALFEASCERLAAQRTDASYPGAAARPLSIQVVEGRSRLVLAAADVVLVASGTATLETLLSRRPMVVAYRLAALTAFLLRRLHLVKVKYFAQPNLLVGREIVPEFFQEAATPEVLGAALLEWLEALDAPQGNERLESLRADFRRVHEQLRCGGAEQAADSLAELL